MARLNIYIDEVKTTMVGEGIGLKELLFAKDCLEEAIKKEIRNINTKVTDEREAQEAQEAESEILGILSNILLRVGENIEVKDSTAKKKGNSRLGNENEFPFGNDFRKKGRKH
jgi:hypothetical protein